MCCLVTAVVGTCAGTPRHTLSEGPAVVRQRLWRLVVCQSAWVVTLVVRNAVTLRTSACVPLGRDAAMRTCRIHPHAGVFQRRVRTQVQQRPHSEHRAAPHCRERRCTVRCSSSACAPDPASHGCSGMHVAVSFGLQVLDDGPYRTPCGGPVATCAPACRPGRPWHW